MNQTSIPPLRVRIQQVSLWQSVIAAYAVQHAKKLQKVQTPLNLTHVQEHLMVSGTSHLAAQCEANNSIETHTFIQEPTENSTDDEFGAYFSSLFFQKAEAATDADSASKDAYKLCEELAERWGKKFRRYSDADDCGWAYCLEEYLKFKKQYNGVKKYNDWTKNGGLNFGVIDYKIPNDAKVAIIGDWGTGMQDGEYLLEMILKNHQPDVIIHLGDIYYAGTPDECDANFYDIFQRLFAKYKQIPVFTIPGNHDYYSFAYGYYQMVAKLNTGLKSKGINATQEASYFCLRTEDNGWQFLGMDTGYCDGGPLSARFPTDGPFLHPNEPEWHQDKLDNFSGASILLSHHQVFSGNAEINGLTGTYGSIPYLNKNLVDFFRPNFGNKVAAWFWGHEHNQVKYQNNLFGLPIGRLVGASAYEEPESETPYKQIFPEVPFSTDPNATLAVENEFFNHGFAIIDFSQRSHPTDAVTTQYFQYPSWGKSAPNPIPQHASPMWSEPFALQPQTKGKEVRFGQYIHLNLELGNAFVGPEVEHFEISREEYLPTVRTNPVVLKISDASNSSNVIQDGDTIYLITQEPKVGKYSHLGAWDGITTHEIYYYKYSQAYDKNMRWKVKKVIPTPNDPAIHENEAVYIFSEKFPGKYLCPYLSIINEKISTYTYLTVSDKVNSNWFIQVQQSHSDEEIALESTSEKEDENLSFIEKIIAFIKSLFSIK